MVRRSIFLFAVLTLLPFVALSPAVADTGTPVDRPPAATQHEPAALQPCPVDGTRGMSTAEVSQTECCKAKKGVCGCRAGKIVCCDGSASPNCTCRGDSGVAD